MGTTQSTSPIASKRSASEMAANEEEIGRKRATAIASSFNIEAAAAAARVGTFNVEASDAASASVAALAFIIGARDYPKEEDSASAGETFNFETSAAAGAAARVGTFHVEASDAASASAAALAFIIGARDDRTEEDSASAGETFNIKAGAGAAVAVAAVATDDDVASTFFFDHEDRQGAAEGATAEAANDLTNAAVDQHEVTVAQVTEQFTIACKYLVDSGLALFLSSAIGGQADTSRVQTYMARTTGFAQFAYERVSMHFIVTNLV